MTLFTGHFLEQNSRFTFYGWKNKNYLKKIKENLSLSNVTILYYLLKMEVITNIFM